MKKIILLLLILLFSFSLFACTKQKKEQTLVVGVSEITGVFVGEYGLNSSGQPINRVDEMVRNLIHGYETYTVDKHGKILLNETVIKEVTTTLDTATGNKTYIFEINSDLYWSDKVNITSVDYVFSILMQASVDWKYPGYASKVGEKLLGYSDYRIGTTSEGVLFKGIQLIDTYKFSVTIDHQYASLFFETYYLKFKPLPFHRLTEKYTVIQSDSFGTWIESGGFSLLADAKKPGGYVYAPDVTCGPYQFVSFINQEVTLKLNSQFKGNFEGKKPVIDNIIIKRVNQVTDVDQVISGELDLVTNVIESMKIKQAEESDATNISYYTRNGFGMITLMTDFGPTADYRVRQAIAYLVDKQVYIDEYFDGYGTITTSEYGIHQWMYQESKEWMIS
ncbi:MAG: ABC transporter substrate-binding protein, partial [Acholeplasmataceae bacterium]|nr:ABC transporter substrate-binding protein [Acholeplasmataceae bacterium]